MRKRLASIVLACSVQYAAIGVAIFDGLAKVNDVRWLPIPLTLCGVIAVLLLGAECLHRLASRRLRSESAVIPWVCMTLGWYATLLMSTEAFLWYEDDASFVIGVMLVLPFLIAIGPLVGAGARLAVAGSALFFTTSLTMLVRSGCSLTGGCGFFEAWVS